MKAPSGAPKRSSTRVAVVSKAMKVVDDETRREVRNKRLVALEADNYNERNISGFDEDAYEEEDELGGGSAGKAGWKKGTNNKKMGAGGKQNKRPKKQRSLDRVIDHQLQLLNANVVDEQPLSPLVANYMSAMAGASAKPSRHFCSVCGYFGNYTCTRCGMRFCTIRCNKSHKETRCLQLSHF